MGKKADKGKEESGEQPGDSFFGRGGDETMPDYFAKALKHLETFTDPVQRAFYEFFAGIREESRGDIQQAKAEIQADYTAVLTPLIETNKQLLAQVEAERKELGEQKKYLGDKLLPDYFEENVKPALEEAQKKLEVLEKKLSDLEGKCASAEEIAELKQACKEATNAADVLKSSYDGTYAELEAARKKLESTAESLRSSDEVQAKLSAVQEALKTRADYDPEKVKETVAELLKPVEKRVKTLEGAKPESGFTFEQVSKVREIVRKQVKSEREKG